MDDIETLFFFRPGDLVLRRRKVLSKIATKAERPYQVVKISGTYHQRITIRPLDSLVGPKRKAEQHTVTVHASQLVPFKPPTVTAGGIESEGEPLPLPTSPTAQHPEPQVDPSADQDDPHPPLPCASKRGRLIKDPTRLDL